MTVCIIIVGSVCSRDQILFVFEREKLLSEVYQKEPSSVDILGVFFETDLTLRSHFQEYNYICKSRISIQPMHPDSNSKSKITLEDKK